MYDYESLYSINTSVIPDDLIVDMKRQFSVSDNCQKTNLAQQKNWNSLMFLG